MVYAGREESGSCQASDRFSCPLTSVPPRKPLVAYALELAEKFDSRVCLLHVIALKPPHTRPIR